MVRRFRSRVRPVIEARDWTNPSSRERLIVVAINFQETFC